MFLLSRYLSRAVLVTTVAGILVFVFLMLMGNVMRDTLNLLAQGTIPFSLFLHLLWLLVPYSVSFAMPMGILIGILLTMGRLSANQELTALKAAGISLWTIAAPALLVALGGSLLALYINAIYAPVARATYKDILNDLVRNDPLRFIVPRAFIHDFPGYVLYVGHKDEESMQRFWLWELDSERRAVRLLRAREGNFTFDEASDALILTLVDGFTELRDPDNPDDLRAIQPTLSFRDARIRLPLANLLGAANQPRKIANFSIPELLQRMRSAQAILDAQPEPEVRDAAQRDRSISRYQISRRFAMAASVFSLALFAIPLGIRVGRTETYANFAIAMGIAMAYYVSLVIIGWAERTPALHPELLVWIPNIVAQTLGFFLLARANRH